MTTLLGKPPTEGDKAFTWTEAVPRLVQVASRAPQEEARKFAMGQLMLLAQIVDRHIAQLQALHDALPDKDKNKICPECGARGTHMYGCQTGAPNDPVQD